MLMRFAMLVGHRVKLPALRRGWTRYVQSNSRGIQPEQTDLSAPILVVLLKAGPQEGHIAVIAEIIDHNRVRPKRACVHFAVY